MVYAVVPIPTAACCALACIAVPVGELPAAPRDSGAHPNTKRARQNQGNKETHRQKHQTKTRTTAHPNNAPRGPQNHEKGREQQRLCGVHQKDSVFNLSNRCTRRRDVHMKQRSGQSRYECTCHVYGQTHKCKGNQITLHALGG